MYKLAKLFLILLLFTACSEKQETKPTTPLIIKTTNGDVRYMVEIATTPQEMQTGLMNRSNLGATSGMLFNVNPVRPIHMWMKDTKIPLDMLFVGPDTSIVMIKENATPMSEEHIICAEPVRAVIEINAGQVNRHGIKIGDKVTHAILNPMVDIKSPGAETKSLPQNVAAPSKAVPAKTPNLNIPDQPKLPIEKAAPSANENSADKTQTTNTANITPKSPVPVPVPNI